MFSIVHCCCGSIITENVHCSVAVDDIIYLIQHSSIVVLIRTGQCCAQIIDSHNVFPLTKGITLLPNIDAIPLHMGPQFQRLIS